MKAPVWAVTDVFARTVPMNTVLVPRVAELVTCQNTLQASAPLIKAMALAGAVVSDEAAWKTNAASGLP